MTLIEVIVALLIATLLIIVMVLALGAITAADTRRGAGDLATAVRYTYNLAAINNKVYALFLDLDNHTYHAAPLEGSGACDRLLIDLEGGDGGQILRRFGDTGGDDDDDDDQEGGLFASLPRGGAPDPAIPAWVNAKESSPSGKLMSLLSEETKELGAEESRRAGALVDEETGPEEKRMPTFRKNRMGEPIKLPDQVRIGGVVLSEGAEPITSGTVPILFYPHGFTQRALIYVESGDEEAGEAFTVEILSLRGSARIHSDLLDPSEFREESD